MAIVARRPHSVIGRQATLCPTTHGVPRPSRAASQRGRKSLLRGDDLAYYRVEDAVRSIVNVSAAISQIAQTTLRAVVGRHTLDETLSETDKIGVDKNSTIMFPAPLMSTIQEIGAFLSRETAASVNGSAGATRTPDAG
jgi:hypothetical protein